MQAQQHKPKKQTPNRVDSAAGQENGHHAGDIVIGEMARIPSWVRDLESFRRWAHSETFPERGWFSHLDGELWVDLSMETSIHNQIKTSIAILVGSIVQNEDLGLFYSDNMLLTHVAAGLSTEPDGMYLSNDSMDKERVRLEEGNVSLEVIGTPDMTLEVVSKTSEKKDTILLKELYWKAGIAEYWLIDSRIESPELDIFRHASTRYVSARKQGGWVKSNLFNRSFRLVSRKNARGLITFQLETR